LFASLRWSLRKPVLVACFTLYPIDFLLTVEMCKDNKGSGGQADSGADPASLVALRAEEARLAAEVQAMALQVAAKRVSWKCFARRFCSFHGATLSFRHSWPGFVRNVGLVNCALCSKPYMNMWLVLVAEE